MTASGWRGLKSFGFVGHPACGFSARSLELVTAEIHPPCRQRAGETCHGTLIAGKSGSLNPSLSLIYKVCNVYAKSSNKHNRKLFREVMRMFLLAPAAPASANDLCRACQRVLAGPKPQPSVVVEQMISVWVAPRRDQATTTSGKCSILTERMSIQSIPNRSMNSPSRTVTE